MRRKAKINRGRCPADLKSGKEKVLNTLEKATKIEPDKPKEKQRESTNMKRGEY